MNSPAPAMQDRPRLAMVHGEAAILEGQWASDHWDAGRLGVPARRGRGTARFGSISQQWLRDPVKRWSRFRLVSPAVGDVHGARACVIDGVVLM